MKSKIIFILALAAMVFLVAGTMGATDYYVATTGSNGGTGSADDPWLTIQHAVNQCAGGETIHVAAGTYQESIDLGSSQSAGLNLIGEDKDTVIWQAVGNAACLKRNNSFNNLDFTMELTGFTFVGGLDAPSLVHIFKNQYDGGVGDCFLDIHDNRFKSLPGTTNSNYGLWMCKTRVDRNPDNTAKIKIHDNVFECVSGICMSGSTHFDIYNNDFSYDVVGNEIYPRKNCALYLGDPCTGLPSLRGGHHIHDNVFEHIGDGYQETIDDVSYYDTIEDYLASPRAAVIIEAGYRDDVASYLPHLIEHNVFNNPNGGGIHYIGYAAGLTFNPLEAGGDIITGPTARENNFLSHIKAVFSEGDISGNELQVDARYNWWGSPTGPCRQLPNGNWVGKGDSVSSNVLFVFWLPHPVEFWRQ